MRNGKNRRMAHHLLVGLLHAAQVPAEAVLVQLLPCPGVPEAGTLVEGIRYAQQVIEGSSTILILNQEGIIAARDRLGLPLRLA